MISSLSLATPPRPRIRPAIGQRGSLPISMTRSHWPAHSRAASRVIHCAGINLERGSQTYGRVHVRGTETVVRAARSAGVPRIALVSFLRARPACGSAYHESKWAAEEIVRGSGLSYTVVKAGVIYGKGDHMLDHLSRALNSFAVFLLVGFGSRRALRPVAVADVARILAASVDDNRLGESPCPSWGRRSSPSRSPCVGSRVRSGASLVTFPLPSQSIAPLPGCSSE